MDPISQGHSMDDGLPQSPSTCSLPTAFDLSRRRHPSPASPTPVGAQHLGRAPRWCGAFSSRGAEPPQDSSAACRNSLSTPQAQPDNAFSNTTVTLSYINRSHVLSAQDQISPKVHSAASQSGGLSRRSLPESKVRRLASAADRDGGGRRVGDPASQPERFDACREAPPAERARGFAQLSPGFNGKRGFFPPGMVRLQRRHIDGVAEGGSRFSRHGEGDRGRGALNGVKGDFWDAGSCAEKRASVQTRVEQSGGETYHRGRRTSRKLYSSLNEDYMSALEVPLSPAVSSGEEMEDASVLPQALNSPGSDSPYAEEDLADGASVKSAEGDGCRFTVQFVEVSSPSEDSCSDDSDVIEVPVTNVTKSLASFSAGLPRPFRRSPALEERPLKRNPSPHAVKAEGKVSEERLNGNTLGERAVGRETRPPRARLGAARQEVVVGNVTSLGSKASRRTLSVEQCAQPEIQTVDSPVVSRGGYSVGDSPCDSEAEAGHASAAVLRVGGGGGGGGGLCSSRRKSPRFSSSGSEDGSLKSLDCSTVFSGLSAPNKVEMPRSRPQKAAAKTAKGADKRQESHAKRPQAGGKAAVKSGKKRKKRVRASQSSAFAPQEPEIKLRYATYREEKRDVRAVSFAPYVHLDGKESSGCTVVNYPEDETGGLKKGRAHHAGHGLATGAVPATSCLAPGRLDAEGRRQREETCCLCGGSANALDLGDLHGPYRPHAAGPRGPREPAEPRGPKDEEACSDSDSSYEDGRGGKYGRVREGGAGPLGPSHGAKRDAALAAQCRWVCDDDSLQGPLAKPSGPGSNHSEQRGTPAEALDVREFWLHEDCGVWSMGVFLVRGKLYGLEEAVRLAQQTICSTCHELGATLGCFFKSCPNKYHYRCAVQSDCVLNEENFTMKCTKHKNKSVKGVSRTENR